jgi:hypothetical protein
MKTLGDLWTVLVVQSGYAPQIEEKNDAKPFCWFPFVRVANGCGANLDAEINHLEFPPSPIMPFIGSFSPVLLFPLF